MARFDKKPKQPQYSPTQLNVGYFLVVLLSGRAAEELVFGEISTGAADDLGRVTDIARQIVTRFGMSKALGQAVFERQTSSYLGDSVLGLKQRDYSEETAREIDMAVKALIDEAYGRAREILGERHDDLVEGAKLLLDKETITPEDFPPLVQAPAKVAAQ